VLSSETQIIDIGRRSPAFPVTPPYMRVRIRGFRDLSQRAGGSRRVSPMEVAPLLGSCRASPYPPPESSTEADWLAHGHP
jgi:hypothetical protein